MKKALLLAAVLLICTSIQAQIVSSRSVSITQEKKITETQWFLRTGLNMMGLTGDDTEDLDKKTSYNITYGFQKAIGSQGAYWGMEAGLGSRGFKYEEKDGKNIYKENLIAHNIQFSPFTFGWKYEIIDNLKLDAHLGAFTSFDYTGKAKLEYNGDKESISMGDWEDELYLDWKRLDAGINVGFGVWYSRFNLDFTYQRGFMEVAKDSDAYASNFMIRLGVTF